eukprot:s1008_g3.t3
MVSSMNRCPAGLLPKFSAGDNLCLIRFTSCQRQPALPRLVLQIIAFRKSLPCDSHFCNIAYEAVAATDPAGSQEGAHRAGLHVPTTKSWSAMATGMIRLALAAVLSMALANATALASSGEGHTDDLIDSYIKDHGDQEDSSAESQQASEEHRSRSDSSARPHLRSGQTHDSKVVTVKLDSELQVSEKA